MEGNYSSICFLFAKTLMKLQTLSRCLIALTLTSMMFLQAPLQAALKEFADVGSVAPDFEVYNRETGEPLTLYELDGQVLIIEFFDPHNCGASQRSAYNLSRRIQGTLNEHDIPIRVLFFTTFVEEYHQASLDAFIAANAVNPEDVYNDPYQDAWRKLTDPYNSSRPQFSIINGVINSPGLKQWEVLYYAAGVYEGTTIMLEAVDRVLPSTYTISPVFHEFPTEGGEATITIDGPGAHWDCTLDSNWLHSLSPSSGFGSGSYSYRVDPNPTFHTRTGRIVFGDHVHEAIQAPKPPSVLELPEETIIDSGEKATIQVVAEGPQLTYQWYKGESGDTTDRISTARSATLETARLTANRRFEYYPYWVRIHYVSDGEAAFFDSPTAMVKVRPPLAIVGEPEDTHVFEGLSTTLFVDVVGSNPRFQWYAGESGDRSRPFVGATQETFTTPPLTEEKQYWVLVINDSDTIESRTATVSIYPKPVIETITQSGSFNYGIPALLKVQAVGPDLEYQWYFGQTGDERTPIEGATNNIFTTPTLTSPVRYWVKITNQAGSLNSPTIELSIVYKPEIVEQPKSPMTVTRGERATLEVVAAGVDVEYQWYEGFSGDTSSPLLGATDSTYQTPVLSGGERYWVRVRNSVTTLMSQTVYIEVVPAPVLTGHPEDATITLGDPVTLHVSANGGPLVYQWYQGEKGDTSAPVEGATEAALTLENLQQTTTFWAEVRNTADAPGILQSDAATVTVVASPEVLSQTEGADITAGETALLEVATNGVTGLFVQWYEGQPGDESRPVIGAENLQFQTPQLYSTTVYWAKIWNDAAPPESAQSAAITVTVHPVPDIIGQPPSRSITTGESTELYVTVRGDPEAFLYQWYEGQSGDTSHPVPEATEPLLLTPPIIQAKSYWVQVRNQAAADIDLAQEGLSVDDVPGISNSATASLYVYRRPLIMSHPQDAILYPGETHTLMVIASAGPESLYYQWFTAPVDDPEAATPIPDATTNQLVLSNLEQSAIFFARVFNGANPPDQPYDPESLGVIDTHRAIINVTPPTLIEEEPVNRKITAGESVTLTVSAVAGSEGLQYQWYEGRSGDRRNPVAGATQRTFTTPPLTESTNYWVLVKNSAAGPDDFDRDDPGVSYSATANITVISTPYIVTQSGNFIITAGESVTLHIEAGPEGSLLSYTWYKGVSGDRSAPLTSTSPNNTTFVTPALEQSASYWVQIQNSADTPTIVNSDTMIITVGGGVEGPWQSVQSLGNDWYYSPWFGNFKIYPNSDSIWHDDHGWLVCKGESEDSIFLWDTNLGGWVWTGGDTYPFVYRHSDGAEGWLWYYEGTNRWFYDWTAADVFYANPNNQ